MDVITEQDQSTDEMRPMSTPTPPSRPGCAAWAKWCSECAPIACLAFPTLCACSAGPHLSRYRLQWDAPHGAFCIGLDHLSAFFLLPILVLSVLAAVYGGNYMLAYRRQKSLFMFWFFYNTFVAGMVMVVIARTAILFLLAWEVMSLSAYFLVTYSIARKG